MFYTAQMISALSSATSMRRINWAATAFFSTDRRAYTASVFMRSFPARPPAAPAISCDTMASQRLQVLADVDSLDWKDYDADTIYQRVTSKVQPGSIVLFHNAALHTPEALPRILSYLINEGYTVVPISQLILTGDYTIDHTGRQFPAENAEQAE